LKSLGSIDAPDKPEGLPTRGEVAEKIAGIQQDVNQLREKRGKLQAQFSSATTQRQAAEAQIAQHKPKILSDSEVDRMAKLSKKKGEHEKLCADIAGAEEECKQKAAALRQWEASPDTCQTCGAPLDT